MLFEVFSRDNQRVFFTEHWSCIPTEDELEAIAKAQYKFKLDGKAVSLSKIQSAVHVEPIIEPKKSPISRKLF
jgi:1,2-phenylacetyl-CoA epoxidase PaaB subunit